MGKAGRRRYCVVRKICLEGFQSGLSWLTILRKRESFRKAFHGFDPKIVAKFTKRDVSRLLKDESIVRHRGKLRRQYKMRNAHSMYNNSSAHWRHSFGLFVPKRRRLALVNRQGGPRRSSRRLKNLRRYPKRCVSGASSSSAQPRCTRRCNRWDSLMTILRVVSCEKFAANSK